MTLITFDNQLVALDAEEVLKFLPGLTWKARADKKGKKGQPPKHNPRYYATLLSCHAGPFEPVRESFKTALGRRGSIRMYLASAIKDASKVAPQCFDLADITIELPTALVDSTRQNMGNTYGAARTGTQLSDETKRKISAAKRRWSVPEDDSDE